MYVQKQRKHQNKTNLSRLSESGDSFHQFLIKQPFVLPSHKSHNLSLIGNLFRTFFHLHLYKNSMCMSIGVPVKIQQINYQEMKYRYQSN